jgi:hypothetical protein
MAKPYPEPPVQNPEIKKIREEIDNRLTKSKKRIVHARNWRLSVYSR